MTDAEIDRAARLFKALGDPARVKIALVLAASPDAVCACKFEPILGLSQATVSHHLRKLTAAGLLRREQRGKWAYFSLTPETVVELAAVADLKGGIANVTSRRRAA